MTAFRALQNILPGDEPFLPKSIEALRTYSRRKFFADLIAGITVGLVAIPLAMAFAIASGVPPQFGIYTAVVAGFVISALGGSAVQIGGPTGAFVIVVSGIIQKHGIDGLYMCTLMAGVALAVLGLTGLGSAVKYIPRPVVIGFTNGIAVIIASTQIRDFFGLRVTDLPRDFLGALGAQIQHAASFSPATTLLGLCTLALLIVFNRYAKRLPGAIIVLAVGTFVAWVFRLPVETIGTRFGGIPGGMPAPHLPALRADLILPLLAPTLTVAMLGAIESLLSAVVADRMAGDRHNPNVELFGQGVANILVPLVGGLPSTGAIARTATNVRAGAKTPVAGMVHALTLLAVLLFATPLARLVPLCVLSAILFVVSWNMGEWSEIPDILKLAKADIAVWIITWVLTVLADLTVAVEAGMILAALLYIRRVTTTTTVTRVTEEYIQEGFKHSLQTNPLPPEVVVYRIHGPFLFGATDKLAIIEDDLAELPSVVVLRLRNMTAIDATGLHALENLADKLHESNRTLILCGTRNQPANLMEQAEFHRHIGDENFCANLTEAVARAKDVAAVAERAIGPS